MGSPTAAPPPVSPTPPPPAPAPAPPPTGLTLARWLYVDEKRTHEVHAGVRPGPPGQFVVKESAYANDDPEEIYEYAVPFHEPWEAQLQLLELENRLGLLGSYWRHDVTQPGWTRVVPQRFESLDLRPVRSTLYEGRVAYHHFHKKGSPDVVLAAIPIDDKRGPRYALAEATFDFPRAEDGDLRIVHPRLPHGPWMSVVAHRHIDLKARGYEKLVTASEFDIIRGKDTSGALRHCYETILRRMSVGQLGFGKDPKAREVPVDDLYTDYLKNLTDPRLLALHARFLTPDEEKAAMAGGERAIKHLIAEKRKAINDPNQNMLLTILEASLLARDGLKAGRSSVDPEVAALVRRFAFYL